MRLNIDIIEDQFPQGTIQRLDGKTFVGIDFGTSTTVVSVASYDSAIQKAHIDSEEIDYVMLIGGSSKTHGPARYKRLFQDGSNIDTAGPASPGVTRCRHTPFTAERP